MRNLACRRFAQNVILNLSFLRVNSVKNLGRGVASYLADAPPQTLRFAQGDTSCLPSELLCKAACWEKGFTLTEMVVSVGVMVTLMSTLGTMMFQAVSTQGKIIDDGLAINELRKGLIWFSTDMKMTQTTNLADGASAATITASWTNQYQGAGTVHTSTYALVGDSLVRTYDGVSHTVGRGVSSAVFNRSGKTVVAQIEVQVSPGVTRTLSVKAVTRSSLS